MTSQPTFTPLHVHGVPDRQWRIVPGPGRETVQCRDLPETIWRDQDVAVVRAEIAHHTEIGQWLARMLSKPAAACDGGGRKSR